MGSVCPSAINPTRSPKGCPLSLTIEPFTFNTLWVEMEMGILRQPRVIAVKIFATLWAVLGPPRNLLAKQTQALTPDLLSQNMHFNKTSCNFHLHPGVRNTALDLPSQHLSGVFLPSCRTLRKPEPRFPLLQATNQGYFSRLEQGTSPFSKMFCPFQQILVSLTMSRKPLSQ